MPKLQIPAEYAAHPVTAFFYLFSRAEYCLKVSEFGYNSGRNAKQYAKADWKNNLFLEALGAFPAGDEQLDYLINEFPKTLRLDESNALVANDNTPAATSDWASLINQIKVVRNNLFHGNTNDNLNSARNEALIKAASHSLECIIEKTNLTETFNAAS